METKTYSKAGDFRTGKGLRQVGNTTVESFKEPGQKHTVYGQGNKSTKAERSARVQTMLDNTCTKIINGKKVTVKHCGPNKDLQDYAERMYGGKA